MEHSRSGILAERADDIPCLFATVEYCRRLVALQHEVNSASAFSYILKRYSRDLQRVRVENSGIACRRFCKRRLDRKGIAVLRPCARPSARKVRSIGGRRN
jgi:hypothetical protein